MVDGQTHDSLQTVTSSFVEAAGYSAHDPLVVGVHRAGEPATFVAGGLTSLGEPMTAKTVVYVASLAKQVTAACAALLVQQGRLELESSLAAWIPELPPWASGVRVRHLVSHTSGLPDVSTWDDLVRAGADRTTSRLVDALVDTPRPDCAAGVEHRYCNAGYVCLGLVVARAAGQSLADFARERVFAPLGLTNSLFWAGPAPRPSGAAPLDPPHPAPLSQGDGGLWSTAADLLRWNEAVNHDALGVAALTQAPGRLDDGTRLDYAWGVGVREHVGRPLFRHSGRWAGLTAQLVRLPQDDASFVVLALDDDKDRAAVLARSLIDELAGAQTPPTAATPGDGPR